MKQLVSVPINAPCVRGLNLQQSSTVLGGEWASVATNCVFDGFGRLASRRGWAALNSSSITYDIDQVHEHIGLAATEIISAANLKLYKGTATLTDITGTVTTPTANNWKFLNFYGNTLGFQSGHGPIVWSGTGNFADITRSYPSSGTETWGDPALAAFGRVWTTTANGKVIKYSALLDETSWTDDTGANGDGSADAGIVDMSTVWPAGMDTVTALAEFDNYLVIFGKRSVVMYSGADDPSTMSKADAIAGIGCIARDSVQNVGTDLLYLSYNGIESLKRTVIQNKNPLTNVSRYIRDDLVLSIGAETLADIRSTYNEKEGLYILVFPSLDICYVLDTKFKGQDPEYRITTWNSITPTSLTTASDGTLYLGQTGYLGKYDTYLDDAATYLMEVQTGWIDLGDISADIGSIEKILKRILVTIYTGKNNTIITTWSYDFEDAESSSSKTITSTEAAEYNIAEYSVDEYGGGASLHVLKNMVQGAGRVFKIGVRANINTSIVALHKITTQFKPGKQI